MASGTRVRGEVAECPGFVIVQFRGDEVVQGFGGDEEQYPAEQPGFPPACGLPYLPALLQVPGEMAEKMNAAKLFPKQGDNCHPGYAKGRQQYLQPTEFSGREISFPQGRLEVALARYLQHVDNKPLIRQ